MSSYDILVGILLPIYKGDNSSFFRLSLESLLHQTYDNIIILVGVDGPIGSNLEDAISEYQYNSKVIFFKYETNRGLAAVLNNMIMDSTQYNIDYFARMDADDISKPDRIYKQVEYLSTHPDIDVVGGAIEEIDSNGEINGKVIHYPKSPSDCRKFFAYRDPLAHPAVMFSSDFFKKVTGYRPEFRKNQDTMLWFDALMSGCKLANLDDVILSFRVSDSLYKRRGGIAFSKLLFKNRLMINKNLGYGLKANFFAFAMFVARILPPAFVKILYRIR